MNRVASCVGARALAALAPDSELSPIEERRLAVHLRRCGACRAFAAEAERVATCLRTTPLEVPLRRIEAPRRWRTLPAAAAAAVAAVVVIGLAGLAGISDRRSGAPALLEAVTVTAELHEGERLRRERIGIRNAHIGATDRAFGAML